MEEFLKHNLGRTDNSCLHRIVKSHEQSPYSICVHNFPEGIYTCGAIIMRLDSGKMHVVKGNPCQGEFQIFSFKEN